MCRVAVGPVGRECLFRCSFFTKNGLPLYRNGTFALTMFLNARLYLVPELKLLIFLISASGSNFNPRSIQYIPVVKIFAFLEIEKFF